MLSLNANHLYAGMLLTQTENSSHGVILSYLETCDYMVNCLSKLSGKLEEVRLYPREDPLLSESWSEGQIPSASSRLSQTDG